MAKINTIFSFTDNISNPLKRVKNSIDSVSGGLGNIGMKILSVNQALQLFTTVMSTAQKAVSTLMQTISASASYEMLETNLAVITGSAEEAKKEFEELKKMASETPFDTAGLVSYATQLQAVGIKGDEVKKVLTMLGDSAMGDSVKMQRIVQNYAQILSVGKASAMDMRQFASMGLPVMSMMKDMGVEGQATAEQVTEMFKQMTSAGGQFYNGMIQGSKTFNGLVSTMGDAIVDLKVEIGKTFLEASKDLVRGFSQAFDYISKRINDLKKSWGVTDKDIKIKLNSLIGLLINLSTVVVTVAGTIATAFAIANWPITLLIASIITIGRILFDASVEANKANVAMTGFAGACEGAGRTLGSVIGFFTSLVAGLMNILYNVIATIYNALVEVSEFILNIFTHPINAIARLFIDLASTILEILSTLGGIIDIFGSNISGTLNDADRKLRAFKEKYFGNVDNKYNTLDMKDVSSVLSGMQAGAITGEEMGRLLDRSFNFQMPETPNGEKLKTDSSGAIVVTDKNLVDIADDYRELLSKRATRLFDLQFSQITPQVQFGDINVSNNVDVDAVAEALINGVAQASQSSLSRS